ncbi:superoxide dismutase [Candidatus Saccharibacteria bacterium 32-45-3]|nr:MAG: superoxide dismutase [Candidatus Saccharibacteria bacterium 32-45-3]
MAFTVPELPYAYDALSRAISKDIMELHHDKHHQTYVDKLNTAIETIQLGELSIEALITDLGALPSDIRNAVRNHGGGHYNHSLFWKVLSPDGGGEPSGELGAALIARYGSYQKFVDEFSQKAVSVFGSGWVWLQPDLSILITPNQDNPLMAGLNAPLLGLDVWEHAYYLDYTYKRNDYVSAWWDVVNWNFVAERFEQAKKE